MLNDLDYIKYLDGVRKEFLVPKNFQLDIEEVEDNSFVIYIWDKKGNNSRHAKSILKNTKNSLVEKLIYRPGYTGDANWLIPSNLNSYFINKGEVTESNIRMLVEDKLTSFLVNKYKLSPFNFKTIYIDHLFYKKIYNSIKNNYLGFIFNNTEKNIIKNIINDFKKEFKLDLYKKENNNEYWFKTFDIYQIYSILKLKGI